MKISDFNRKYMRFFDTYLMIIFVYMGAFGAQVKSQPLKDVTYPWQVYDSAYNSISKQLDISTELNLYILDSNPMYQTQIVQIPRSEEGVHVLSEKAEIGQMPLNSSNCNGGSAFSDFCRSNVESNIYYNGHFLFENIHIVGDPEINIISNEFGSVDIWQSDPHDILEINLRISDGGVLKISQ